MRTLDRVRQRYAAELQADPETIGVKSAPAQVSYNPAGSLVTAVANTATVDNADEVVVPEGAELSPDRTIKYFGQMRSIYYNHDYGQTPIGALRNARLTSAGWVCQFSLHGRTPLSSDLNALFALGDDNPVRGVSIGFVRTAAGAPTDAEVLKYGPHEFITRRWVWLELSVTPMPCNPDAIIQGVTLPEDTAKRIESLATKGVITKATARILGVPEPRRIVTVPRVVSIG